jgi:type IV pilus assembly protein PilA
MKNVKKQKNVKNNKGFSLVELIVVIAIMAVLVGILAPQFMGYVEKSREATDIQNLDSIRTQVETYCADHPCTKVTVSVTSTGTTALLDDESVAPGSTDAIISTSSTNKLKSQRIKTITAIFSYLTNSWEYTITAETGKDPYYIAAGAAEITAK